jgi:hypothetical protein
MIIASTEQVSFWTGDVPTTPLVFELEDANPDSASLDLSAFDSAVVTLVSPEGFALGDLPATLGGATVTVTFPGATLFVEPGMYTLMMRLAGTTARTTLPPFYFIVDDVDGWHTLDSARAEWPDAPAEDVALFTLLAAARTAVIAYAPALLPGVPVEPGYRQAQLMQARNVWNATKSNDNGEIGADGFAVRVFPLDKNIRQLLRPKRGLPVMF